MKAGRIYSRTAEARTRPLHRVAVSAAGVVSDLFRISRRRRFFQQACAILLLLVLSGCSLAPDYVRPDLPESPTGRYANEPAGTVQDVTHRPWWAGFHWDELDALITEGLRMNPDLRAAGARVLEARAVLDRTGAPTFPFAGWQGAAERSEVSGIEADRFQLGLSLSYELDIWGRIHDAQTAAERELEASGFERLSVYHNLVADLARNYVGFVFAERQRLLAVKTAETNRQSLALVEFRYKAGLVPALDVFLARQNLAASESRIPLFEEQVARSRHRLNILLGRYPGAGLSLPDNIQPEIPGPIPAGLPSDLLTRRPDLLAAEARLMAANARVGVARAGLFPRLTLTASGGYRSPELADLFVKESELWSLAAGIAGPVFEAGRNIAEVKASRARLEAAAHGYVKTVLLAMGEVEDALLSETTLRTRRASLLRSVEEAEQAFESSRGRYLRGLDSLIPTLNSERALYAAEVELIENERNIFLNRVALYLSLGGNWEADSIAPPLAGEG